MANELQNIKINYLAYDYDSIKNSLKNYSQTYFPNSYTDFSDSSPVGFFMSMVSYVGDLMSYYIDKRYQESIMQTATDRKSVVNLSKFLGYNHRPSAAATVDISVYQLIPKNAMSNEPDYAYALKINPGMIVNATSNGTIFRTLDVIDFSITSSTDMTLYDTQYQNTSYFVLKKTVAAIAANQEIESFTITGTAAFQKLTLSKTNVLSIIRVTDSDDNIWYEVPYLAQDTVAEAIENTTKTNTLYTNFSNQTPYLLNLKKATKRFIKRVNENDKTQLIFGAGTINLQNEDIIPTQDALSQLFIDTSIADRNIDTRNFLRLDSLGEAPANTTLTVTYYYGGGVDTNVVANDITAIQSRNMSFYGTSLDTDKSVFVMNSLSVNNLNPAVGGRGTESTEEIKQNALSWFAAQNRMVTKEDYEIRTLSLDPKFGSVEKIFALKDNEDPTTPTLESGTISLYCLAKTVNNKMSPLNQATKYNLMKYLEQYRMMTDNIAIRDAYVINIGVQFSVTVNQIYNPQTVLLDCLNVVKDYFSIDRWKIGQPIIKGDIINLLYKINGVKSVNDIKIVNKRGNTYSSIYYDIDVATKNEIVYSSLDPAIFEVKFPDTDIQGIVI